MSNQKDHYWMKYAIQLAKYAWYTNEVPIGAVLVYNNMIIGKGWNQMVKLHDPTAHAEISALRQGGVFLKNYRLLGSSLYVTQEPCIMCAGAIVNSRIYRLIFGAYSKKASAFRSLINVLKCKEINHKVNISSGVLINECSSILISFFKMKRKKLTS